MNFRCYGEPAGKKYFLRNGQKKSSKRLTNLTFLPKRKKMKLYLSRTPTNQCAGSGLRDLQEA